MKYTRKKVIGVKTETTQSTAITLTAGDYLLASNIDVKPVTPERVNRNPFRASLGTVSTRTGMRWSEGSLESEIKGVGAGVAWAPFSAMMQASGMTETIVSVTSVTYALTSSPASGSYYGPGKSATVRVNHDGYDQIIAGCLGKPTFTFDAGKLPMLKWQFFGNYAAPTDASSPTATPDTTNSPICEGMQFTLHSVGTLIPHKVEIAFGADPAKRPNLEAVNSLMGFVLSQERAITMNLSCEMESVATFDYIGKLVGDTLGTAVLVSGATAGNICTMNMSRVQLDDFGWGDHEGKLMAELKCSLHDNADNDAINFVFT